MKSFSKLMVGAFAATLGALAMAVLFHVTSWGKDADPLINVETTPVNRDTAPATSFAPIVKKAAPSVVNIYTTRIVHLQARRNPFSNDPLFRQFFGDQFSDDNGARTRKEHILGSGIIVSPDGYILTANHVVSGEEEIKVAFGDGNKKEYTAKIIGGDPQTDVAVLKIDAKDLPAITLADSDQLEIGDVVLAIGNPFNIGQTVTMGIVSALGRSGIPGSNQIPGLNQYQDFIQTDAAINPGNSGGALVDTEGRLIGVNTAIVPNENGGNQGIGFAVPINLARHVMEHLISTGKVTRGFLGVSLQDLDSDLAKQFNLPDQNGALVDDVVTNSPAEIAGLKSGDVIVAFNGQDVPDANSLLLTVSDCLPGSQAVLKLIRDGNMKIINVTLAEKPGEAAQSGNSQNNPPPPDSSKRDALDGVTVADLDQDTRQQLRIPDDINGALVTDVAQDSNSADAGLQTGDIILEINRQTVSSAEDAILLCKSAQGDRILLKVWRHSGSFASTRYLSVDNKK
jgi:serine protease Do